MSKILNIQERWLI